MSTFQKEFDVIVVGSGPGGASVARGLSKNGKKVLILEMGDYEPTKGTFRQMLSRGWVPVTKMPLTTGGKPIVRAITTGGTTNFYSACAYEPPFGMLKKYGIDITQEIADLRDELPIDVISDELMNPAASLFMKSARELGYDCRKLDKLIYQDKCKRNCQFCTYGCPNDAKWNARYFVDEAVENGAQIINHAKVRKVITENGVAIGVEYKRRGKTHRTYAEKIVIGAGGIGSPGILKKSGIKGVGSDFCTDPLMLVMGKVEGLEGTGRAVPMMTGFRLEEEGIMFSDLHIPQILKVLFDVHAFNFGEVTDYSDVIPIMVKIRDDLSGKIINNGLVSKKLSKEDKQKLALGETIARNILVNAGAKKTYSSRIMAAHPGATVKIGEHLDKNLKTRFDNLYVCDCSAFPEPMGIPPTLTILGLGTRLAAHLLGNEPAATNH